MLKINYDPDVLSCLANLSNDEVFMKTYPALVKDSIWSFSTPKSIFFDIRSFILLPSFLN